MSFYLVFFLLISIVFIFKDNLQNYATAKRVHAIRDKIFILQLLLVLSSTLNTVWCIEKNGLHVDETLFRFSSIKSNQFGPSVSQTAVHSNRWTVGVWIFITSTVVRSVYYVPFINCYCRVTNVAYTKLLLFFSISKRHVQYIAMTLENFLYNRDFNRDWQGVALEYYSKINVLIILLWCTIIIC